jgi:hypothetical protein
MQFVQRFACSCRESEGIHDLRSSLQAALLGRDAALKVCLLQTSQVLVRLIRIEDE